MFITFQVMDYDGPGKADEMCSGCFSLSDIEQASKNGNKLGLKNKKEKDKGYIIVHSFDLS